MRTSLLVLLILAAACADAPLQAPVPSDCGGETGRHVPCEGVELLGYLRVADLAPGAASPRLNDVWGWTDPETGLEYALVGRNDGVAFVDVTDPAAPRLVGQLPMTQGSSPSTWRDTKVHADHAFVVADGAGEHGMQIFDLRRLRGATGEVVTFDPDVRYDGIASAHNVAIDTEAALAVIVGANGGGETCGGGLHMVDIEDPLSPAFLGCFNDPATSYGGGYTHDVQCVTYAGPDARYTGRRICLGANQDMLSIADVTDPAAPVALAAVSYPAVGYLHQGWLTDDHRYFYMDDELDEIQGMGKTRTLVWDLGELDDPVLVNEHRGTTRSSDHNLYVLGDRLYQANYTSGLRVLDITDPEAPVEVGYLDTVPYSDEPGFRGAWSVYPYLPSGTILVSSIDEGLFVLRLSPD